MQKQIEENKVGTLCWKNVFLLNIYMAVKFSYIYICSLETNCTEIAE